jgi:hypothetical protein
MLNKLFTSLNTFKMLEEKLFLKSGGSARDTIIPSSRVALQYVSPSQTNLLIKNE